MLTAHDNILLTKDAHEYTINSHQRAHSEMVHMLCNKNNKDECNNDNRSYSYDGHNNNTRVNH